jgi:hypothetical protein
VIIGRSEELLHAPYPSCSGLPFALIRETMKDKQLSIAKQLA